MKKIKFVPVILLFTMLGNACKKDTISPANDIPVSNPVIGTWTVSSFVKDKVELANQFTGYTLTCTTDGKMFIQGHGSNYSNCSWNTNGDDSSMCHFHIMGCDDNSVLWECDDDWDLTDHDAQHCYFSSHNPQHHSKMTWTKM